MAESNIEVGEVFFRQFLEDYFAECDELLTSVRVRLLTLEEFLDQIVDPAVLDNMFRAYHTLKGISSMVGLTEAETLAHNLESSLRILRDQRLTEERLNSLVDGTESLVKLIEAHRAGAGIAPQAESAKVAAEVKVDKPADSAAKKWRFTFSPTSEGVASGFNVNSVRSRLQGIGNILSATPSVGSDGSVAFEFVVTTATDEAVFNSWQIPRLSYVPVETSVSPHPEHESSVSQAASPASAPKAVSNLVRVDLDRLNELMLMIGEVGTTRARLETYIKRLRGALPPAEWRALQEIETTMSRQMRSLRDGVMRVRMVPLGEIFERMRFVVRDLARENQKRVRLVFAGENTEIDKFLVQRMMDPLLHLVRNAVSHGLESVEERVRLGKPAAGRITLRGSTEGDSVLIEVEDDGRGIDIAKVEALARKRGLISSLAPLDGNRLFNVLAAPRFSTRERTDRESGRGVGLDVVKQIVEELNGSVRLCTEAQKGTCFTIQLPLTLALADAFLATAGGQTFAVPQSAVREIIEVDRASIKGIESNEVLSYRGNVLRLIRLARTFRLAEESEPRYAMVVGNEGNLAGLMVDRVLGQREIVVRAATDPLLRVPAVSGATESGDGRLILILDVRELLNANERTPMEKALAV